MTGRRIRWLAVTVVAAVVGLGLTASISTPASANMASAYTGATTTVAWKLAPSIHDLATLRANPGAQQTYFGTGAPACTEDSRSFQVDVYKYDAKHKPLVDALVAGGILYIAPKTPNDPSFFPPSRQGPPPPDLSLMSSATHHSPHRAPKTYEKFWGRSVRHAERICRCALCVCVWSRKSPHGKARRANPCW